jgi:hypothetical protein
MLLFLSCQKEPTVDTNPSIGSSDPTLNYILSLGFKRENVVEYGDYYIVEGDMKFSKKDYNNIPGARLQQRFDNLIPIINHDIANTISVRVDYSFTDPDVRQKVINAAQASISSWNSISVSKLRFIYFSGSSANITLTHTSSSNPNTYAVATPPINCGAGPSIGLTDIIADLDTNQLHQLLVHEMGHCAGFRHTDESYLNGPYLVPLTPYSDANSVMNSGAGDNSARSWTGFTAYDVVATQVLYPTNAFAIAEYNNATDKVDFRWTPSKFCNTTVTIQMTLPNGSYSQAISTNNDGTESFQLDLPGTYKIRVFTTSVPALEATITL